MTSSVATPVSISAPARRRWRPSSLALITLPWLILYLGGIFTPGLLDDVDSVYIEVAREMLLRHDYVTPFVDGIRFFDKPPLIYWLAAGSMHIFGPHDWAARLPLALGVLALLFAVYALGIRLFAAISPAHAPDRAGLYAALAMALSIGPWLYTRFYIPDILIALWMTLAVHLFLIALERANDRATSRLTTNPDTPRLDSETWVVGTTTKPGAPFRREAAGWGTTISRSPLLPMLGFAAVLALSVLTKGLIGLIFPLLFAILYLALTRQLRLLRHLHSSPPHSPSSPSPLPWHILAALRNPAIPMPSGLGLPPRAGWAWFYLYNEHIARFLGHRIPHDYGQVPIPLFWLLLVVWLFPWAAFLPSALIAAIKQLRSKILRDSRLHEAALALLLWAGIILGFFTLSSRQEYYHLPALPALALLVGALLACADQAAHTLTPLNPFAANARAHTLRSSLYGLVPIGTLLFLICGYFALFAPSPRPGTTLNDLLSSNPALYNLSLGHVFDLTGSAMGFFRWPLATVALAALVLGPIQHLIRRSTKPATPSPRTSSSPPPRPPSSSPRTPATSASTPSSAPKTSPKPSTPNSAPATSSSSMASSPPAPRCSSTPEQPALLVNGRVNGPWFGSFFPDAPSIFLTDSDLTHLWSGPHRIFLLTYHPTERENFLTPFAPVHDLTDSGGKTLLSNRE